MCTHFHLDSFSQLNIWRYCLCIVVHSIVLLSGILLYGCSIIYLFICYWYTFELFWFGAIKNKAAIHLYSLSVDMFLFLLRKYQGEELLGHMVRIELLLRERLLTCWPFIAVWNNNIHVKISNRYFKIYIPRAIDWDVFLLNNINIRK